VEFVPLSSGGVFAEAVLGRFNSAEKLDISRFWNWQDSPIPLQPSEIAPLQAASRAQPEAIAPGQLSSPIVNITQPSSLPDPSGMSGVLAAIQNGNMFRDMSGMSEVVKLAQSAIQASSGGAAAAGAQAGSDMQAALNAAADTYKAFLRQGGDKKTVADKNPSTQGALINEQDKRKTNLGGATTPSIGATPTGLSDSLVPSGGYAGGETQAASGSLFGRSSSSGNPALDVATFGPEGKPTDESIRNALGLDPQSPVPTPAVTADGVPLQDLTGFGKYSLSVREKEGAQLQIIDMDTERQFIGSNFWLPSSADLGVVLGKPRRQWESLEDLVSALSFMPQGSVKSLSLVGCSLTKDDFSFQVDQAFDKQLRQWILLKGNASATPEDIVLAQPPFQSIRLFDLLVAPDGNAATIERTEQVPLPQARKTFAANCVVNLFNLGMGLERDFIQLLANFLQVKTVGFLKPVRVLAEEIGVSDQDPPSLLKSYRFCLGYVTGDQPPARTFERLEQLLNEPDAFTAFPRRP